MAQMRTIMVNELAWIGGMMRELRNDSGIEVTARMIAEVDQELKRINEMLLVVWSEKGADNGYCIDFHFSEALRLYYSISLADIDYGGEDLDLRDLQYGACIW